MRKFGYCMEGLEGKFEDTVRSLAQRRTHTNYLELGVGHFETMGAVIDILKDVGRTFWAIGIDTEMRVQPPADCWFIKSTTKDALRNWAGQIDLCLIDACHCEECVCRDFEMVEAHITLGGMVLFHDFGPKALQSEIGQHDGTRPIGVRRAVDGLGLTGGTRPGWTFHGIWPAAYEMAVFEKV